MLVVDASVAVLAFGNESLSRRARFLIDGENWRSPDIFLGECANTLARLTRTRTLTVDIAQNAFEVIRRLAADPVETTPFVRAAFRKALDLNHSVFDCLYLEVARRLNGRLVTIDSRFITKLRGLPDASLVVHLSDWREEIDP